LEDLGVDGRIISEQILEKYGGKVWTRFLWCRSEGRRLLRMW